MSEYVVTKIFPKNTKKNEQVIRLLEKENIRRDKNLEYTCGIFDEDNNLIATGSCFGNTLRCLAVASKHQGEGLMNLIVIHLVNYQFKRGIFHLFIYTKAGREDIFKTLGFYEIVTVDDHLVFLENRKNGFENYLNSLHTNVAFDLNQGKNSAIIMNANPFSLGHQYLVEEAAKKSDLVHLFVVSEDSSIFPFSIRKRLIEEGTAHLKNVVLHPTEPYMISNATFPSYFQKDETSVIEGHALLDIKIFQKIAERLAINCRYAGEEPFSLVTGIYNNVMNHELRKVGIEFIELKRKEVNAKIISASKIRQALKANDLKTVKDLVPETTFNYLVSEEALPIIEKIKMTSDVVHY